MKTICCGAFIAITLFFPGITSATTDGLRTVEILGRDETSLYLNIIDESEAPEFQHLKYNIKKNELYSTDLYYENYNGNIDPWAVTEKIRQKLKPVRIIDESMFNQMGYSVSCGNTMKNQDFGEDKIYFQKITCIVEKDGNKISEAKFPMVAYNQIVNLNHSFIDRIYQVDKNSFVIIFVHTRSMECKRQEFPLFTTNPVQKGKLNFNELKENFLK